MSVSAAAARAARTPPVSPRQTLIGDGSSLWAGCVGLAAQAVPGMLPVYALRIAGQPGPPLALADGPGPGCHCAPRAQWQPLPLRPGAQGSVSVRHSRSLNGHHGTMPVTPCPVPQPPLRALTGAIQPWSSEPGSQGPSRRSPGHGETAGSPMETEGVALGPPSSCHLASACFVVHVARRRFITQAFVHGFQSDGALTSNLSVLAPRRGDAPGTRRLR